MGDWDVVPPQSAWTPVTSQSVSAAQKPLVDRVKYQESHNHAWAVSPKGAVGTMQTMPATLKDPGFGVTPAKNEKPEELERVGKDYLKALQGKYKNDMVALAAYNWGPGNVNKLIDAGKGPDKIGEAAFISQLPGETQHYIHNIMHEGATQPAQPAHAAHTEAPAQQLLPAASPQPIENNQAAHYLPGFAGEVEKATLEPLAQAGRQLLSPLLSDQNRQALIQKGLLPAPPQNIAQGIHQVLGPAATALTAGISGPIAPIVQPVMDKLTSGLSPAMKEKLEAGMDIASLAIPGLKPAARVAGAAEKTIAPEVQMAEIERRMDKGEIPREQAMRQMEQLRQKAQPVQEEKQPVHVPHPNEVQMAEIERRMDKGEIPREQAMQQMDALQKDMWKPKYESKIFTNNTDIASTKPISSPQGLADRLYSDRNQVLADEGELVKFLSPIKQDKGMWEKFQAHMDDPKGVPLSTKEQSVFDNTIGQLKKERDEARSIITKNGFKAEDFGESPDKLHEDIGGATRQVKGKNTPMDILLGIPKRQPVSGRSLSRTAASLKPRSMMAITDNEGRRSIVYKDDAGDYRDASNPDKVIAKADAPVKEGNATQKEIESATGGKIQYHKNSLGVQVTSLLQERRAARVIQTLDAFKKDPEFASIARGPGTKVKNIPSGWKEIPDLPVFRGWHFSPEIAEEIEDHLARTMQKDGPVKALQQMNRFMLNSLFWANPIPHAKNVLNAFAVSKGFFGGLMDLPGMSSDFLKSVKSVVTRDKTYMKGLRSGVPYSGAKDIEPRFKRALLTAMDEKARAQPESFGQFAKEFGFNRPVDLIKRVGQISHSIPFGLQDILQQTLERNLARKGLSQAQATEQIAKTLPSYRTYARIAGSRTLGKAAKGTEWFQFPGWDIGRLQGLGNILKGSAKLDPKSLDQLLMMAVLYEFGSKIIDPLIQQATGNEQAQTQPAGYSVFPARAEEVLTGQKTPAQAAQSLMPFGYLPQAAFSVAGVNPYTGKPISLPGESPLEVGFDYAKDIAGKVNPIQRFINMSTGYTTPQEEALGQLGIKAPSEEAQFLKVKAQKKTAKELKSKRKFQYPEGIE